MRPMLARVVSLRSPLLYGLLPILMACCLWPSSVRAQDAAVTGRITDPQKAIIVGAKVTAVNVATNVHYETTSNNVGDYYIPGLPPGTYRIEVEQTGFKTVLKGNVVLHVQDTANINFEMALGSASETITVEGGGVVVNTTDATVSTVVDRQFVENIPLNGRSFQSLINMTPGVTLAQTNYLEQGQFSVNGARTDTNYFTVDGTSANFAIGNNIGGSQGSGSQPAFSVLGGTNSLVSVDAIQEFQIQTSTFAPEFGRTPGAQVAIATRSGTNQFHGTAFDYFRNGALDANDYFANLNDLGHAIEKQNDFGGVFGGPIFKDKTFFFFSYEGLRLRLPATAITSVPDNTLRTEAPAALQPFVDASPIPNGPEVGDMFATYSATYVSPATLNAYSLRIDHNLNSKMQLFARYNYSPSSLTQRGGDLATVGPQQFVVNTGTLGFTWTVSTRMTNEFRFNYSDETGTDKTQFDNFGGATPIPDSVLFYAPFNTKQDEYQFRLLTGEGGFAVGNVASNENRQLNIIDNYSWTIGPHQLKFGADYRRLNPTIAGAALDEIPELSGSAGILSATTIFGTEYGNTSTPLIFHNYSFYGQDTWKVSNRLTLTYGLRWDINPAPTGDGMQFDPSTVADFNNLGTTGLAPLGTPLYHTTYGNFAPRIGVAYRMGDKAGWDRVIRGGFGIFYDLSAGGLADLPEVFPFASQKLYGAVPFPLSESLAAPLPSTRTLPTGFIEIADPHLKLPRTYQWNFAIEQSLGTSQTLTASYIGSAGRDLLFDTILYYPNGNFVEPVVTNNAAKSNYDALQVKFQRKLTHHLQALATYTWAHSLDTESQSSFSLLSAPFLNNIINDYGDSDFDIRHQGSLAFTYDIPAAGNSAVLRSVLGGWSLDSIFSARTANPVTLNSNLVIGFGGFYYPRPDVVPGQPLYLYGSQYAGGKALNPLAFTPPPDGTQGDLGRNTLRGYGLWQDDFDVRRQFRITEKVNLQFRCEFFNIFNHPNFGNENNTLGAPFFGESTSMFGASLGSGGGFGGFSPLYQVGGPRSIQLALKLIF